MAIDVSKLRHRRVRGADDYPPRPMLAQTRAVLTAYAERGASFGEEVLADCGHTPQIEQLDRFQRALLEFLESTGGPT